MSDPEKKSEALASCAGMEKHLLASLHHVPKPHSELVDQTELEYQVEFKRRIMNVYSICLLYTSPSPRDQRGSRMPSSA